MTVRICSTEGPKIKQKQNSHQNNGSKIVVRAERHIFTYSRIDVGDGGRYPTMKPICAMSKSEKTSKLGEPST